MKMAEWKRATSVAKLDVIEWVVEPAKKELVKTEGGDVNVEAVGGIMR